MRALTVADKHVWVALDVSQIAQQSRRELAQRNSVRRAVLRIAERHRRISVKFHIGPFERERFTEMQERSFRALMNRVS